MYSYILRYILKFPQQYYFGNIYLSNNITERSIHITPATLHFTVCSSIIYAPMAISQGTQMNCSFLRYFASTFKCSCHEDVSRKNQTITGTSVQAQTTGPQSLICYNRQKWVEIKDCLWGILTPLNFPSHSLSTQKFCTFTASSGK